MIKRVAAILYLTLALLCSPQGGVHRGSLVVFVFSKNSDFIIVAAESREIDRNGKPLDDRGCKVITLGKDTLFFTTGSYRVAARSGEPWNALKVAGAVYKESKKRDALSLSNAWGKKALQWFSLQTKQDLEGLTEKTDRFVTGGFVNFMGDGIPSVQYQVLGYSRTEQGPFRRPGIETVNPGQVWAMGNGQELLTEFLDGKTKRAVEALGPNDVLRFASADPAMGSNLARKAIEFAVDNTTGAEKSSLGGPIDIAILRKNGTIEWVSRKRECYKIDQDQNDSKNLAAP